MHTSKAIEDVAAERQRQASAKGWTPEHDDEHLDGAIALAGAGYAEAAAWATMAPDDKQFTDEDPPTTWPDDWTFKPADPRRMLVKAAALLMRKSNALTALRCRPDAEGKDHEQQGLR